MLARTTSTAVSRLASEQLVQDGFTACCACARGARVSRCILGYKRRYRNGTNHWQSPVGVQYAVPNRRTIADSTGMFTEGNACCFVKRGSTQRNARSYNNVDRLVEVFRSALC